MISSHRGAADCARLPQGRLIPGVGNVARTPTSQLMFGEVVAMRKSLRPTADVQEFDDPRQWIAQSRESDCA
jgi:hypothetical protein